MNMNEKEECGCGDSCKCAGDCADKDVENKEEAVTISKAEYEELLKAKEEKEAAKKDLLYAYADMENFKRRKNRDLEDQIKFANEKLIKDVLPVIDNLHLALEHAKTADAGENNKQIDSFLQGVELISKQLLDVMSRFGVECISSEGSQFDPNFHEALDQQETEDHQTGKVIKEYQKGYLLKGRVLRCSKVSVAKKK
jgi:molecular chaperone GrpE